MNYETNSVERFRAGIALGMLKKYASTVSEEEFEKKEAKVDALVEELYSLPMEKRANMFRNFFTHGAGKFPSIGFKPKGPPTNPGDIARSPLGDVSTGPNMRPSHGGYPGGGPSGPDAIGQGGGRSMFNPLNAEGRLSTAGKIYGGTGILGLGAGYGGLRNSAGQVEGADKAKNYMVDKYSSLDWWEKLMFFLKTLFGGKGAVKDQVNTWMDQRGADSQHGEM